jgi:hypothetical protein
MRFLSPGTSVGFKSGVGSTIIAGNCMLPTKTLTSKRSAVECLGASREAASTVTVDHFGGEEVETSEARGVQWSEVEGTGSVGSSCGVSCKKTNGERIIRRRFPSDVVISRSSSWPIHM